MTHERVAIVTHVTLEILTFIFANFRCLRSIRDCINITLKKKNLNLTASARTYLQQIKVQIKLQ